MESLDNIINLLLRPEAYIASKDLMDAFFSVPISAAHQKYLKIYLHNCTNLTVYLMAMVQCELLLNQLKYLFFVCKVRDVSQLSM